MTSGSHPREPVAEEADPEKVAETVPGKSARTGGAERVWETQNIHARPEPSDVASRPRLAGREEDLGRIEEALTLAREIVLEYTPGAIGHEAKSDRGDPVTAADHAVDEALREALPTRGEAWLSEETADRLSRVSYHRVWVVDPLDGTREFVEGIPEWCISIGLVEGGIAVAGGVLNPATGERIVGSIETGVTLNDRPAQLSGRATLEGANVLASRSEVKRGEWERFEDAPFEVVPCGSVAYKLARVAVGTADATWTLVPKNEWDVVAGAALVRAAGGVVVHADGTEPAFNRADTLLPNLLAGPEALIREFREAYLEHASEGSPMEESPPEEFSSEESSME